MLTIHFITCRRCSGPSDLTERCKWHISTDVNFFGDIANCWTKQPILSLIAVDSHCYLNCQALTWPAQSQTNREGSWIQVSVPDATSCWIDDSAITEVPRKGGDKTGITSASYGYWCINSGRRTFCQDNVWKHVEGKRNLKMVTKER